MALSSFIRLEGWVTFLSMNKLKYVFLILKYVFKYIVILVFYILKFTFTLIPILFAELFKIINKRLRFSITFKTTSTYTLIFTIILLLVGTGITCAFGFFLLYQTNISLVKNNRTIVNYIQENTDLPRDKIDNYAKIEGISVDIFDQKNQPVHSNLTQHLAANPAPRTRLSNNISVDGNYLYFDNQIKLKHNIGKIELAKSLATEKHYLRLLITALIISFLLAIIISSIIGTIISRKMLRPIDNMTQTARSISAGDLDTRLDLVDSHDELKDLAVTFNEMLDRIQGSFEQQNVFVSDASHELRTPISVIQGYANLLQRWGKEDQEVLDESIAAIKSEADYMKELVEKLLFLASADKKKQRLEISPVVLHELINEVLKESQMIDSTHHISSEVNDKIMLNGDRTLIKQALRIFIDNSLKFTPSGGTIKLNSFLRGNQAVISVEDNGIGIAAEDLPHIFNRFYKSDKSRIREGGGAGLGLSIGKWIIEQHKGEIKIESNVHKGTKIIIILPVLS